MKSYNIAPNVYVALEQARSSALNAPETPVSVVPLKDGKYLVATGYGCIAALSDPAAGAMEQLREEAAVSG